MTGGGPVGTVWPRLGAHGAILLALGALWIPRGHVLASASAAPVAATVTSAAATPPLEAMALRPRLATALPDAGSAVFIVPPRQTPLPARASTGARRATAVVRLPAAIKAPRPGSGNDISWPQCGGSTPGAHDVGVVGVTGGRPFTTNPCLSGEYSWARASRMAGGAQLYLNLELGGSSNGPHSCANDDHVCRAYDYGWQSVTDAMTRAGGEGAAATFWWLDVELGNSWSADNPDWNARTVQGAIDGVRSRNLDVGIYSSADQWAQIVPRDYKPGVPTWLAVVGNQELATGRCSPDFSLTGGAVYMVQFDDHVFDSDHVCPTGTAGFAAAATRRGH